MKRTYRADLFTYCLFGFILFILPSLGLLQAYFGDSLFNNSKQIHNTCTELLIIIIFFIWIRRFKLVISDSEISYRSVFKKNRVIKINDIKVAGFARINYTKNPNGELPQKLPSIVKFGLRNDDPFNYTNRKNKCGIYAFIIKTKDNELEINSKFFSAKANYDLLAMTKPYII